MCAGYELKKAGFDVQILEASSRVGGRVKTFKDPFFAPGLHGEGGAMRIPKDHFLTLEYVKKFGLHGDLFPFEQENKFIFLEGYGSTLTYDKFNELLKAKDAKLLESNPSPARLGRLLAALEEMGGKRAALRIDFMKVYTAAGTINQMHSGPAAATLSETASSSHPIGLAGSRRATTTPAAVNAHTNATPVPLLATLDDDVENW